MKKIATQLLLLASLSGFAQVGLDMSFGTNGFVVLDGQSTNDSFILTRQQPDGKILVSGNRINGSDTHENFIVRLDGDGSIDTTFGNNGYYIFTNALFDVDGPVFYLLSNGKIICISEDSNDAEIIKLNANGTVDPNFGVGGKMLFDSFTRLGPDKNYQNGDDLYLGLDANIIMGDLIYKIAKVDTNTGTYDPTFGVNGILPMPEPFNEIVGIVSNRFIIRGGATAFGIPPTISNFLQRFNMDGTPDTTFGTDGKVMIWISNSFDESANFEDAVAVSPDHSMYVSVINVATGVQQIRKFNANGQLASGFANSGILTINNVYYHNIQADDQNLTVFGASGTEADHDLEVRRYSAENGSADNSFNNGGFYTENTNVWSEQAESVDFSNPNMFVAAGEYVVGQDLTKIFVAKYLYNPLANASLESKSLFSFENPVGDQLRLFPSEGVKSAALYGIDGRFIRSAEGAEMPTADLSSGIYLARIDSEKASETIRFIKR